MTTVSTTSLPTVAPLESTAPGISQNSMHRALETTIAVIAAPTILLLAVLTVLLLHHTLKSRRQRRATQHPTAPNPPPTDEHAGKALDKLTLSSPTRTSATTTDPKSALSAYAPQFAYPNQPPVNEPPIELQKLSKSSRQYSTWPTSSKDLEAGRESSGYRASDSANDREGAGTQFSQSELYIPPTSENSSMPFGDLPLPGESALGFMERDFGQRG